MAYDARRGKTVLFSGYELFDNWVADTWEWDGLSWVQAASTGPIKRDGHGMAFDSLRGSVVLFGGTVKGVGNIAIGSDTWEYCPTTTAIYYLDEDGDGFGDPRTSLSVCVHPPGYATNSADCDDAHASVHSGAPEISDGIDNQCLGDAGYGSIDEIDDSADFEADKITLTCSGTMVYEGKEESIDRSLVIEWLAECVYHTAQKRLADGNRQQDADAHER
jgi:hypothetical protein